MFLSLLLLTASFGLILFFRLGFGGGNWAVVGESVGACTDDLLASLQALHDLYAIAVANPDFHRVLVRFAVASGNHDRGCPILSRQ